MFYGVFYAFLELTGVLAAFYARCARSVGLKAAIRKEFLMLLIRAAGKPVLVKR